MGFCMWSDTMVSRSLGTAVCVLNIIAGGAGVFGGLLATAMVVGFGGTSREVMIALSLSIAGALFALSGIVLVSSECASRAALGLLELAILVGLIYFAVMA